MLTLTITVLTQELQGLKHSKSHDPDEQYKHNTYLNPKSITMDVSEVGSRGAYLH